MTKLYNLQSLKQRRRYLRKNQTFPETLVWNVIRSRQINGFKFKRQYSIGSFIVDFFCPELRLAIEIDGDTHYQAGATQKDQEREHYLKSFGVKFLRFTNYQFRSLFQPGWSISSNLSADQTNITSPQPLLIKERRI